MTRGVRSAVSVAVGWEVDFAVSTTLDCRRSLKDLMGLLKDFVRVFVRVSGLLGVGASSFGILSGIRLDWRGSGSIKINDEAIQLICYRRCQFPF